MRRGYQTLAADGRCLEEGVAANYSIFTSIILSKTNTTIFKIGYRWPFSNFIMFENYQACLVHNKSSAAIVLPFLPTADTLTIKVYLHVFSLNFLTSADSSVEERRAAKRKVRRSIPLTGSRPFLRENELHFQRTLSSTLSIWQ